MPRDSGDDAYAWLAAKERATTVVEAGETWVNRETGREITISNGGFLPAYESADSWLRYRYVGNERPYECTVVEFVKLFEFKEHCL